VPGDNICDRRIGWQAQCRTALKLLARHEYECLSSAQDCPYCLISPHHTKMYNADDHGSYMCDTHAMQIKVTLLTIVHYPNPQKTTHSDDTSLYPSQCYDPNDRSGYVK